MTQKPHLTHCENVWSGTIRNRKKKLTQEQDRCRRLGIACLASVVTGRPWEAIINHGRLTNANLTVIGAHDKSNQDPNPLALRSTILGSTAERVVRHSDKPVLVATGQVPETWNHLLWSVAIDFSNASLRALQTANDYAVSTESKLQLIHVLPHYHQIDALHQDAREILQKTRKKQAQEKLLDLCNEYQLPKGTECIAVDNNQDPVKTLAQISQDTGSSIMVMGTRGHTGIKLLVLGSTVQKYLRQAQSPVLVVP